MKQYTLVAAVAVAIVGVSAVAGAVRANEMAEKAAVKATEQVQSEQQKAEQEKTEMEAVESLTEISAEDLQVLIDTNPDLVLIDARRASDYAQGHIPGAVAVTPGEATPERLAALAPNKDTPIVFYCGNHQCPASGKAAYKAAQQGYKRLYKYTEGIEDWRAKGLPVVTERDSAKKAEEAEAKVAEVEKATTAE